MPTPTLDVAARHHRRSLMYRTRARAELAARDAAILAALAEGYTATGVARALDVTEGSVRKVRDRL